MMVTSSSQSDSDDDHQYNLPLKQTSSPPHKVEKYEYDQEKTVEQKFVQRKQETKPLRSIERRVDTSSFDLDVSSPV
jgi:hypothetical protein